MGSQSPISIQQDYEASPSACSVGAPPLLRSALMQVQSAAGWLGINRAALMLAPEGLSGLSRGYNFVRLPSLILPYFYGTQ